MTLKWDHKRFTYVPGDGFEDEGVPITPYDATEFLNKLYSENEKNKRIIQKQEMALNEIRNSRYECRLCGCVSILGNMIIRRE